MARAHSKKRYPGATPSQPGPEQDAAALDDLTQLSNRIALLTLGASLGFMVGLVALSAALAGDASVVAHVGASLPFLATAAAVMRVRQLRSELRRKRDAPGGPARPIAPEVSAGTRR